MEGWHKRCAFAARGNVAASEVSDDADAREFSEKCRMVELQREAALRPVANCLSVRADGGNVPREQAAAF